MTLEYYITIMLLIAAVFCIGAAICFVFYNCNESRKSMIMGIVCAIICAGIVVFLFSSLATGVAFSWITPPEYAQIMDN